jgi:hypothetical protein
LVTVFGGCDELQSGVESCGLEVCVAIGRIKAYKRLTCNGGGVSCVLGGIDVGFDDGRCLLQKGLADVLGDGCREEGLRDVG